MPRKKGFLPKGFQNWLVTLFFGFYQVFHSFLRSCNYKSFRTLSETARLRAINADEAKTFADILRENYLCRHHRRILDHRIVRKPMSSSFILYVRERRTQKCPIF